MRSDGGNWWAVAQGAPSSLLAVSRSRISVRGRHQEGDMRSRAEWLGVEQLQDADRV